MATKNDLTKMWNGYETPALTEIYTLAEYAAQRITENILLTPYKEILLYPGWPDRAEHLRWIVTAEASSIEKWARAIEDLLKLYDTFDKMSKGELDTIEVIEVTVIKLDDNRESKAPLN